VVIGDCGLIRDLPSTLKLEAQTRRIDGDGIPVVDLVIAE